MTYVTPKCLKIQQVNKFQYLNDELKNWLYIFFWFNSEKSELEFQASRPLNDEIWESLNNRKNYILPKKSEFSNVVKGIAKTICNPLIL